MTYTFDSKETYLAARSTWRNDYEAASQAVRDMKQAFKVKQREFSATTPNTKEYWAAWDNMIRAHSALGSSRNAACKLLEELSKMKFEAERQWQEAHQKVEST